MERQYRYPLRPRDARVPGRQARRRRAAARLRGARAGRGDRLPRRRMGARRHAAQRHRLLERRHRGLVRARPAAWATARSTTASCSTSCWLPKTSSTRGVREGSVTDAKTLIGLLWLQNWRAGRWPLQWQRGALTRRCRIIGGMKVLNLRCAHDHRFEGWFASEDDFDVAARARPDRVPAVRRHARSSGCRRAPRLNLSGAPSAGDSTRRRRQRRATRRRCGCARCARSSNHRGRRRALRRRGAPHPLRRGRAARHPRPRVARAERRRCATKASR